ncbi:NAD(P)/FAD-dependent oxidoreductase [Acanthopleuribacter pedis]|uniref:FAD-dependent oxidoreductase n=1 Tax=Acanthopleuribacter pedis TaxID=442870 RepID=A0A8J7U7J0_9BACT|nr:FAD-dependent oxidoreductase [Acanthopleuribacter pedis]MBO1323054.1 FAD-dependent oxidoreductase [Acanthopleuribacter pedis]
MTSFLYQINNLRIPVEAAPGLLPGRIAKELKIKTNQIVSVTLVREAIDARKKPRVFRVVNLAFTTRTALAEPLPNQVKKLERDPKEVPRPETLPLAQPRPAEKPVVVIGAGPAGLFAALALCEAGVPTVLLERGKPVETRMRDIGQLRSHGVLDPESNVCFGEGGAGTYTDGKLYTRIKHPFVRWVYRRLVDFGAPERILVDAHPHLGTDKLVKLVKEMRLHLIAQGTDVRFGARVTRVVIEKGSARGVELADGSFIAARAVVLAVGHSARDTLAQLHQDGVRIEPKPFAVGVRAEHPQTLINQSQFGTPQPPGDLEAAAYRLTHQADDPRIGKRGVYSFCMCPGGFIVPSPTEPEHMAINGMSNANRSAPFANSGIVVQVTPEDLIAEGYQEHPLMGIQFQRDLEAVAFRAVKEPFRAPAMRIDDFVKRKASGQLAAGHFRPGVEAMDLWDVLPHWIATPMQQAFKRFDRLIAGYASSEGNILAVESRTSAPIRITRDARFEAEGVRGLFPIGEGAGYAGGIVSAAVDGLRVAEILIGEP